MAATDYDVLIIGSGASGGMAAYTLAQKGVKCLMLDAGPPVDFTRDRAMKAVYELPYRGFGKPGRLSHVFQANEFNANQWADETQNPYTHDPKEPYNWVRVRLIGGKSLFWARMSFRLSDYEFKAKDHDGFGDNWPLSYSDLAPYYDKVEPIFRVSGRKEGLAQLPDGNFVEDKSPDSETMNRIASAGKPYGITVTKIRRALGDGRLASSFNLLLPDAVATGNLTIVPNAVVREVTVDRNTGLVNGAAFVDRHSRRELHAKARAVIVGASCLESTRLLLNSKIANSSGVLGHYLHDQVLHPEQCRRCDPGSAQRQGEPGARRRRIHSPLPQHQQQTEEFHSRLCDGFLRRRNARCQILFFLGRGTAKGNRQLPRSWFLRHCHG